MKRVRDGECILIDGATGTEVERKGVPQLKNAWNGGAALSHPDIVRQVHQDYINLGAEIVISILFQRISMLYLMPIKAITLKF